MDSSLKERNVRRERRAMGVRRKVRGTASIPRLSVVRSNKHLFVQLIDDENSCTLAGVGTMGKKVPFGKKSKEAAKKLGERIAELAKEKQITRVIFDRAHYKFHGLLAAIATGARESGLHV